MCKWEILLVHKEEKEEEKQVENGSIAHKLKSIAEKYNESFELLAELYV